MCFWPPGGAQGGIWAGNTLLWAGAAGPLARVRVVGWPPPMLRPPELP